MAAVANDSGLNDAKGRLKRLSLTPGASIVAKSGSNSPTPAPSTPTQTPWQLGHGKRYGSRRMSSISYYNSTNTVPSPTSSSSGSFVRSPTILEEPNFAGASNLHRATSLPRRVKPKSPAEGQEKSKDSSSKSAESPVATAPPVQTLAEKHADLLSFIAQKESKCMELRDALAQQEAELAGLKRKWERIVARASTSGHGITASSSSPDNSPVTRAKPLPPVGGADVVGVLREGVTGLGRMLVMGGLGGPLASPTPSAASTSPPANSPRPSAPTAPQNRNPPRLRQQPPALRLGPTSRNSSLSSFTVNSPPGSTSSAGRDSVSSVTSLGSSDGEEVEDKNSRTPINENGAYTPTLNAQSTFASQNTSSGESSSPEIFKNLFDDASARPKTSKLGQHQKRLSSLVSPTSSTNLADRVARTSPARLTSPTQESQASWVPVSLNKKMEALTKSSKRASLLFSDASNLFGSLTGALSSNPGTPSPSTQDGRSPLSASSPNQQRPATYFQLMAMEGSSPQRPSPSNEKRSTITSLLDEDNDDEVFHPGFSTYENDDSPRVTGLASLALASPPANASGFGSQSMKRKLSPILVPNKIPTSNSASSSSSLLSVSTVTQPLPSPGAVAAKRFEEDDSWNW